MRDGILELRVPEALAPSVTRALAGATQRDRDVDAMSPPAGPRWLTACFFLLRRYRAVRPPSVGQRCVWDPSCSRYAELALRQRGLIRGLAAAAGRLLSCRPGRGGVDLP
jgi:putative component of membrane protein insertase Oxa1/YidC/SpoIIIJ protein YidD